MLQRISGANDDDCVSSRRISGSGRSWSAKQPTIADVALFPYTYMAEMGGYSLQAYPHIRQWRLYCMVALDGFQSLLAAAPNLATHKEAENG
ncbi:hypothetical protein AB4141_38720 [Cupriavidus sp. 2KB_15]|uniref:hypothetical protein n=1 Tax=Cupriavidus sp. 2KB_15 TaxID=3232976 RepID=UPI003F93D96D